MSVGNTDSVLNGLKVLWKLNSNTGGNERTPTVRIFLSTCNYMKLNGALKFSVCLLDSVYLAPDEDHNELINRCPARRKFQI